MEMSDQSMVMDHAKMTFAELSRFRMDTDSAARVVAFQNSPIFWKLNDGLRQLIIHLLFSKPRKNQAALTSAEKQAFNAALSAAISAGTYATMAAIHADMSHMMHGFMGPVGALRFLPWHRAYLYEMEQLLQTYVPGVTIPYWDWAHDHTLPDWVLLPAGVTRGPDTSWTLPSQTDINVGVLAQTSFVAFENNLENYHNTVHMFVGGNKMPFPSMSPQDPMFWLHHSNVDRIWTLWQAFPYASDPPLTGANATMDPWTLTSTGVLDTYDLWYYYA